MIRVGWAKEDPGLPARVHGTVHPGRDRGADALVRRPPADVDVPENAVASRVARQAVDIVDELPRIAAPTLVLQAVGDRMTGFDNAVSSAARIPAARLVAAREPQPHPPRRRARVGRLRARGRGVPRARPAGVGAGRTGARRGADPARARRPPAGAPTVGRTRRSRATLGAERADRRAAPLERLRQAGGVRPGGAGGGRRGPAAGPGAGSLTVRLRRHRGLRAAPIGPRRVRRDWRAARFRARSRRS